MLQDIYPHKLYNQYNPEIKASDEDFVLMFEGRKVLSRFDDDKKDFRFPTVREVKNKNSLIYLFAIDEEKYFLLQDKEEGELEEYSFNDMKEIRENHIEPKYRIYATFTGKHLSDWYGDMKFCGRCGSPMKHSDTQRAMICTSCGYTAYPRIMPAVIVGVINGDKLLLTKYNRGYNHNALIAGFTEIGETVEETVEREVMEEAGIKVKNIRYYKSQPWGVANDILMGYYCEVDGDDTIHRDEDELKSAEWTLREDIVLQPDESSLTNEMMKIFKEGIVK